MLFGTGIWGWNMEDVDEMKKEGFLCTKKDVPFWSRVMRLQ